MPVMSHVRTMSSTACGIPHVVIGLSALGMQIRMCTLILLWALQMSKGIGHTLTWLGQG